MGVGSGWRAANRYALRTRTSQRILTRLAVNRDHHAAPGPFVVQGAAFESIGVAGGLGGRRLKSRGTSPTIRSGTLSNDPAIRAWEEISAGARNLREVPNMGGGTEIQTERVGEARRLSRSWATVVVGRDLKTSSNAQRPRLDCLAARLEADRATASRVELSHHARDSHGELGTEFARAPRCVPPTRRSKRDADRPHSYN